MMRLGLSLLACVLFVSFEAKAEPFSVEVAYDSVDITTGFTGAHVTVFGVKRDAGQLAVVLEGPKKDIVVRRKDRFLGAWLNRSWLRYEDVPQYYGYALEKEGEAGVYSGEAVGVPALSFLPSSSKYSKEERARFHKALIESKQEQRLFFKDAGEIHYIDGGFFRTAFYIPANVPTGDYVVRGVLIRKGEIVARSETPLKVEQVGFSADVFKFAHNRSLLYAIICVFIAVLAGWVSNKIVRRN